MKEVTRKRRKGKEDPNELEDESKENFWDWNTPVSLGDTKYLSRGR